MSITAAALRRLADLKLAPEQMAGVLAVVAEIAEAAEQRERVEEQRKAKDRDRKRRGKSTDIPRKVRGNGVEIPAVVSPKETSPTPPKEITPSPSLRSDSLDAREPAPESGCRVEFTMTFWPRYPHKVGRPAAIRAFIAARNRADLDAIMAGLERYIRDKPPDRPWLNPATFLYQDRYADEPAPRLATNGNHSGGPVRSAAEVHTAALARAVNRRAGERERQAQPNGGIHGDDGTITVDFREVKRPEDGTGIGRGGGQGKGH